MTALSARERLALMQELVSVLASAGSVEEATREMLRAIAEHCDWQLGLLWLHDGQALSCRASWAADPELTDGFIASSQNLVFAGDEGIIGLAWTTESVQWLQGIGEQETYLRRDAAQDAGLRASLAVPVYGSKAPLGVMEFISTTPNPLNDDLVGLLTTLGRQVGIYLERRQAEDDVRASEAAKSAMLRTALDAVVSIDARGRVTEWNPAAERMFGYAREEALGGSMAELIVPPRLRDAHFQGFSRHIRTGEAHVLNERLQLSGMRKDGSEMPVELAITRHDVAGSPSFTAYLRDMSEHNRTRGQLNLVLEGVADGVIAVGLDSRIAYANAAAAELMQYESATKMMGQTLDEHSQRVTYRDEQDEPLDPRTLPVFRVLSGEDVEEPHVVQMQVDGAAPRWLRVKAAPLYDEQGQLLMAITVFSDVTEERRISERLRTSRDQLETVLGGVASGVVVHDQDGEIVYINPAAAQFYGFKNAEAALAAGRTAILKRFAFFDEFGAPLSSPSEGDTATLPELRAEAVLMRVHTYRTGEDRWMYLKSTRAKSTTDDTTLIINLIDDVTEHRRLMNAVQRSRDELDAILQGVGDSITASGADGQLMYANRAALEVLGYPNTDALRAAEPDQLLARLDLRDEDGFPFPVEELPLTLVIEGAEAAEAVVQYQHATKGDRWGLMRSRAIPDRSGGMTASLTITEDITAQKREEHKLRNVAETLQASILPAELPAIPHSELAVCFSPRGGDYHEVGGDFYDAFQLNDTEWLLFAGDVCGKGPEAAAVTSLCRYAVRALSMREHSPAALIDDLNETLIRHREDGRFATVALARLCPRSDGITAHLALGGHPQPVVLRAAGMVETVGLPGTLVGAFRATGLAEETPVELGPGDTLLLYTDGISEARNAAHEMFDLKAFLAGKQHLDAQQLADAIEEAVKAFQDGPLEDDIALIAVRAPAPALLSRRFAASPGSVPAARHALTSLCEQYPDAGWDEIKLLVTELVTNAVRHSAPDAPTKWFSLSVSEAAPGILRFAVTDPGRPFVPRVRHAAPDSQSGRGLLLVDALADRWGSSQLGGNCIWFERAVA